jgi:hypothetical protein
VDGRDLLILQQGLGTMYRPSDFALWKSNFGRKNAEAIATAVPEPAGGVLFMIAAVALSLFQRALRC